MVVSDAADHSQWWTVFNDPHLDNLVQTAYQQNLPLRVAALRVMEARAQLGVTRGNIFPQQQELFGDYEKSLLSKNTFPGNLPGAARSSSFVDVGFDAAWELDVWGRFRRAVESAETNFDATIEDYDDALVTLIADVAATYVDIRTAEQQLAYQLNNVDIQKGSMKIAKAQFDNGAVSELDVKQAETNVASTESVVPALETQLRQSKNRLCVLLGMPPHQIDYLLGDAVASVDASVIPIAPVEIAVGIPADLLRRRPDVRAAERRVASQSALIGVAASDLFPSFTISGSIGYEAGGFNKMLRSASSAGFIAAPSIQWPILNYGRIRNNIAAEEAVYRQLALTYEQTVLSANQEVEDALTAFLKSQERYQKDLAAVTAAQHAVDIATAQYQQGATDFNRVFTLQGTLANLEGQLAQTMGNIATSLIGVYKAMGGGWQIRENSNAVAGELLVPPQPVPDGDQAESEPMSPSPSEPASNAMSVPSVSQPTSTSPVAPVVHWAPPSAKRFSHAS